MAARRMLEARQLARANRMAPARAPPTPADVEKVDDMLWCRFKRIYRKSSFTKEELRRKYALLTLGVPFATKAAWAGYQMDHRAPGFREHLLARAREPRHLTRQRIPPLEATRSPTIIEPPRNHAEKHDGKVDDTDDAR